VNFAEHVESLASYLFRSYGDASGAVVFQEDIENVDLSLDMAIPCGLIINELVSNSLKYAFPDGRKGEIRVGLRSADDRFTLVVADNGVGLPADVNFRATDTMGLQVVTTLVKQLDGKIELERRGGTAFEITFPESG
jgi:two-component sensor histidine kinase